MGDGCDGEVRLARHVQALTTVSQSEEALALARSLTGQRLAAGVQIVGPIRSVYWWQGSVQEAEEWQLLVKTTAALFAEVKSHIKENHSHVTPEIIATEIVSGSVEYLRWISEETRRTDGSS
ncbi:divalent-cation tolerance protein CutA [Nonomuraea dietziae]|uniref:divalent-cation tolerance protein CutA n=1 Tax=Nonomuraea dietziae TaxID=65515 RepID=UPI0033FBB2BE